MQRGIGTLMFVLTMAASAWSAEPSRVSSLRPLTFRPSNDTLVGRTLSVLARHGRPISQSSRSTFRLRLVVDSSDPLVDVVESVEETTEDTENEAGVATLTLPDTEAATDEPIVPPKPLSDIAVPIDGAAEKAEREPKKDETKPATSHFSLGGLIGDRDKLGILELESRGLPVKIDEHEKSTFDVNFGYAIRWLNGPSVTDLPPQLYTLLIDVAWAFRVDEQWKFDALITPLWNTDFENKTSHAFRLPWHTIVSYQANTDWQWVMGITDLDRRDVRLLPVIGFRYTPPGGTVELDLVFPKPRLAWRPNHDEEHQCWFYVAGELGGGSWAINRADRSKDIVTLRDLRLLAGLEVRTKKRHAGRLEAGWVFDRAVDYQSGIGDYHPADTAIIRWSSDY